MRDNSNLTLHRQNEFARVYNRGESRGSKYVVVLYRKNNLGYTRAAFVSSKKVGNSVQRNRSRRLMRESYRSFKERIIQGYDLIFVARNSINEAKQQEVERAMYGALKACELIGTNR